MSAIMEDTGIDGNTTPKTPSAVGKEALMVGVDVLEITVGAATGFGISKVLSTINNRTVKKYASPIASIAGYLAAIFVPQKDVRLIAASIASGAVIQYVTPKVDSLMSGLHNKPVNIGVKDEVKTIDMQDVL